MLTYLNTIILSTLNVMLLHITHHFVLSK